jgi:predicted lysophospholipase L1 biosynthesis ABC-type transport system permease subunit
MRVDDSSATIVGVVADVTYQGVGGPLLPEVYVPWAQSTFGGAWVAVKTARDVSAIMPAIRDAVHSADPLINARELRPMDTMVSDTMVRPRFQTWLLTTFGGLALVLAAVGIYGVIAYGVAQRTAEIGLRLALGAPPRSVVRLLLSRGMGPVFVGLGIGLAVAFALSRLMTGLLYGTSPTDAPTFVAMAVLLAGVAMLAAYLPASRATRLDPLAALRSD